MSAAGAEPACSCWLLPPATAAARAVPASASAFPAVGGHGGMLAFACGRDDGAGWPCALLARARALRGAVLKPLAAAGDARGARERAFYASVFGGGGVGGAPAPCVGASGFAGAHALRPLLPAWLGECAGGYLAGHATCCDVVVPGYCGGAVGCAPSSYALGLADIGVAEPWARGHGPVLVAYDDAAVAMLRLDPAKYGGGANISMLYWQGPILDRQYKQGVQALATFHTEISSGSTQYTKGQMVGTPALFHTTYGAGKGRVLISPPHPEETQPRLDDIVESYILWASSAI